jgi:peptide/nickel transport system permease protein
MSAAAPGVAAGPVAREASAAPSTLWASVVRSKQGRFGVALVGLMLAVIAFGRFIAPYDPSATGVGPPDVGPSGQHLLGTDALGRDVLSRLLTGGDQIIVIPVAAVLLAYAIGGSLGFAAAYRGGRVDSGITRLFNVLMAMPTFLLVLVTIAAVGPSFGVLVLVITLADLPRVGRIVRGLVLGQATTDYVTAARARGERAWSVFGREIAPNIVGPAVSDLALRVTYGIIVLATLSFLGLGTQPPEPDWSLMIQEGRASITAAPLGVIAPATAIALLSVGFNLIADATAAHIAREEAR